MNNNKNKKLSVNDLPKNIPDYNNSALPKDKLTAKWLSDWIRREKANKTIKAGDILPSKSILANFLGVSTGTVENAVRFVEDEGLLGSRQRTGTFISDCTVIQKQTSKRETAISKVKKFISEHEIGYIMPTVRNMSKQLETNSNTIRLAYIYLISDNILGYSQDNNNKKVLKIIQLPEKQTEKSEENNSLTEKITKALTEYLKENLKKGDKIPPRSKLSTIFRVSIKTIHDSVKILEARGILLSRRGKYGTILIKNPKEETILQTQNEYSIFAKSKIAAQYRWEKIEKQIKSLIKEYYEPGNKLPSMESLAKNFDVSTNTIRQALKNLAADGWVEFSRGRYGGTFVVNIPETGEQNIYEWIALAQNPQNKK